MDQTTGSTKPWRRIRRKSWFLGILLTTSKNRRGASAQLLLEVSSSTPSVEPHHHSVEIPCGDELEGHQAPSPKLTHSISISAVFSVQAEHGLRTPPPERSLKPSATFPVYAPPSQKTPTMARPERVVRGGPHRAIEIPAGNENQNDDVEVGSVRERHQLNRDDIHLLVKKKNLSSLRRFGGVGSVASALDSDLEMGRNSSLDTREARVADPTAPTPAHPNGYLFFLVEAFNSRLIMLLAAAAILLFIKDFMAQGFKSGWHDGAAMVAAIFLLVTIPSAAKHYQAKKLEKKQSRKIPVKVTRSGADQCIEISEVEEGDVVKLEVGSFVPADGLLIDGNSLVLDEILNPEINQDHNPFLFFGSRITSGSGTMLVTSTADRNALLVKELSGLDPARMSILEDRVNIPHNHIEILGLIVVLVVLFQALVRVPLYEHGFPAEKPEFKGEVTVRQVMHLLTKIVLFPRGTIPVLASSLALIVIGLQHGVPVVISLNLAHWNPKNLSAKVRNLWACATMGIVTVLYVNTTCGLISDQMEVTRVWVGGREILRDEEYSETPEPVMESLHQAIEVSARVPEISASPRNSLLIQWANSRWGLTSKFGKRKYSILDFKKLRSDKKGRGTLMREEGSADDERILHLHWKGAASSILDMCSHYINRVGERRFLEEQKEMFKRVIKDMEESGLLTIAFATRRMDVQEIIEDGLDLLAVVGLRLIISNETKSAVRCLREKGICIMLVSEDEPSSLRAMARELEVEHVPDLRPEEARKGIKVIEGLKPEENHKCVRDLKGKGDVVAFYGGSTCDVPTMKEADLAIVEYDQSTQMAKDTADVILNKGIASLVPILELGRRAYSNIQVFTRLQLVTWISWFVLTLIVALCSGDSPSTPPQQIWVSAIMSLLGGLMMRMELKVKLAQKPARRTSALIEKAMWTDIGIQVFCQMLVFLLFQFKGQDILGVNKGIHSAMMFTSFTLCQVLNQVKATKTGTMDELVKVLRKHQWFSVTIGAIIALQVLWVQFGQSLADGLPLSIVLWIMSSAIAMLPLILHCAISGAKVFMSVILSFEYLPTLWNRSLRMFVVIPFSMFLIVSTSHIIHPVGVHTFR